MSENQRSCVVVGAGISGLLAAKALNEEGWTVTVLDKGRGVGGRMATRRVGRGTFDHGAQFFTVRGERFAGLVEDWLGAGVAAEWTRGFADAEGRPNEDGYPRYRGAEGMTSIPKYISRGLDVRTGERAVEGGRADDGWEVACESGLRVAGSRAACSRCPFPRRWTLPRRGSYGLPDERQAPTRSRLLRPMPRAHGLARRSDRRTRSREECRSKASRWIGSATTRRKGISEAPAITVHAGPEWSRAHFEDDETEITRP